jgi:mannose-6-phosphate isomerase
VKRQLPPLVFAPILKEKIWGGQNLASRLNKKLPPGRAIGECWEISGVKGDETLALSAPFAKMPLAIVAQEGAALLGRGISIAGGFPLLYKFIDAQDKLSVQVHPDDEQSRSAGCGSFGKTECWYVVDAKPGAQLICGVNPGVTREDIRRGVASDSLQEYLNIISVKAGDMVFVPARTIHAICEGILLYEVQQSSDTTYRLYDWGRTDDRGMPRDLHVDQSLKVLDTSAHAHHRIEPLAVSTGGGIQRRLRVACAYFAVEEYEFTGARNLVLPRYRSFAACTFMRGRAALLDNGKEINNFKAGDSLLLPASIGPNLELTAEAGTLLVISWIPDLAADIIAPLRAAGHGNQAICALGGNPAASALAPLL